MTASVTKLLNATIAGTDSVIELADANGVKYQLEADSTTGQLLIKRNGTAAAGFGAYGAGYRRVQAKASSYTVTAADAGTLFTTTGASGAVTFTLPAAASNTGAWFEFYNVVDQNMIIAAPADTMVGTHDATFTSATYSTASEKIGAGCRVTSDGSKWLFQTISSGEIVTPTFA